MNGLKNAVRLFVFVATVLVLLSAAAFSSELVLEHELGTLTLQQTPKRVIVFDYGVLDALDNLNVEVLGLPASNLPNFLGKFGSTDYVNVGTLFEPNFEVIYGLKPDLIIISTRQASLYDELNRIAPTLYVAIDNTDYWGSFRSNLKLLGTIFAKQAEVAGILADLEAGIEGVREKVVASGQNALIVMANDGALSVYGENSRFGLIHQAFGFPAVTDRIETATHGQNISFEYLIKANPDVIFVVDRAAVAGGSVSARQTMDNVLVKMTNAAKNETIIYLNSHAWYVVSGGITSTKIMLEDMEQLFR